MSLRYEVEGPEERYLVGNWENAPGRRNQGDHVLGM